MAFVNMFIDSIKPIRYNSLFLITQQPSREAAASQALYLIIHTGGTYSYAYML